MPVRTYDPKQVSVLVAGVPIGGFADGTAISVIRSNDSYSKVSGADGVMSRAKSNDISGEVTLTLSQTSPSNDYLSSIQSLDSLSGTGVVPVLIQDNSGRSKYVSGFAWVRKPPDSEFGKEISNREWVLDCADLSFFTGGNPDS
jgi:hypothetical protein